MPTKLLLKQINQLQQVSARLESIAEKHPTLSDPLFKVSQTIRACATFLDVLVATMPSAEPA
jgi:hypothetical protein